MAFLEVVESGRLVGNVNAEWFEVALFNRRVYKIFDPRPPPPKPMKAKTKKERNKEWEKWDEESSGDDWGDEPPVQEDIPVCPPESPEVEWEASSDGTGGSGQDLDLELEEEEGLDGLVRSLA